MFEISTAANMKMCLILKMLSGHSFLKCAHQLDQFCVFKMVLGGLRTRVLHRVCGIQVVCH